MSVLFFTVADAAFEHFVAPFVASALITAPNSGAEIMVEDADAFRASHAAPCAALEAAFPGRWTLTSLDDSHVGYPLLNRIQAERFLRVPTMHAKYAYTYISDIDFILLGQDLEAILTRHARKLGLCYSNMVRLDARGAPTRRLTGLHFVASRVWYSVVTPAWIQSFLNGLARQPGLLSDEQVLYRLTEEAFSLPAAIDPKVAQFRPQFGYHLSPNRQPIDPSAVDWGIVDKPVGRPMTLKADRWRAYRELEANPRWQAARATFDPQYLALLDQLEAAIAIAQSG